MAFSSTVTSNNTMGSLRAIVGTYNAASVTTGTITLPMLSVLAFFIDAGTSSPSLPYWTVSGSTVTITGLATSQTGRFLALGQ